MTCFATILDPARRELRFVSCGHPAPYLCRLPIGARIELQALVGRGNPLGTGLPTNARLQRRPLETGDLVVWYTDGVVEAQDPAGAAYGDRRLQHLLKSLDRPRLTPLAVHDLVHAGVDAHRAGRPPGDDETLVVAQLRAAPAPVEAAP
jgi:sigma-B regulation protein RsbU (phosphoserine phosphatase)